MAAEPSTIQNVLTIGTLASAFVTALVTYFLYRVTRILAVETKRMADASSQPQIVAGIVPNQWSTIHLDIVVENTGNASAFEVEIEFDPQLQNGEARGDEMPVPLQNISVLKPGQRLASYLSGVEDYLEKSFTVTTSWKLHPNDKERETLTYILNMGDYSGVSYLGSRDPIVQVADQMKKLREDWQNVAKGTRRIRTEVFDASDRKRENDIFAERFGRNKE